MLKFSQSLKLKYPNFNSKNKTVTKQNKKVDFFRLLFPEAGGALLFFNKAIVNNGSWKTPKFILMVQLKVNIFS